MASRDELEKYHEFIDGLVARREGVLPQWITQKGWPAVPEYRRINDLLSTLAPDERAVIAEIVRQARDGGIHDCLVFLQEQMDAGELRITLKGIDLPASPHGTSMFWDWVARAERAPWPEAEAGGNGDD